MSTEDKWTLARPLVRKKYRKRRNWNDDEEAMVCAQTQVPAVSVLLVARRYDVNANQVFNWLKEPKFSNAAPPDGGPGLLAHVLVNKYADHLPLL